jgi:hypothetical protein
MLTMSDHQALLNHSRPSAAGERRVKARRRNSNSLTTTTTIFLILSLCVGNSISGKPPKPKLCTVSISEYVGFGGLESLQFLGNRKRTYYKDTAICIISGESPSAFNLTFHFGPGIRVPSLLFRFQ